MNPNATKKYRPFPPVDLPHRQWPDRILDHAPIWCSVDLRDGNQALPVPMNIPEKLEMFDLLCRVGFKQIEVGFPSASDTEFNFLRALVDEKRIPDDVTVQVLVQAREHLIRKTFEALHGVPRAIVHLYNSTSPLQRRITFGNASKEEIKKIAIDGTNLVTQLVPTVPGTEVSFQYSPESFSDTELDFSLEVCESVMDIWQPSANNPIILNLPATVEWTTPNVHADQIEWFANQLAAQDRRDQVHISLHTHNDRGTGVAATELGLLAGADRVEGTLFGNGERTGNLDIVTVALNLNSHGIESGLNFNDLPAIREVYERTTRLTVPDRQPYAGELVFTAFSGSHQDAIKKGFDQRTKEPDAHWAVPYLTIDPNDIGRTYEAIIRINSQSGKGGIAYILDREHGFDLPKAMHPHVGKRIYDLADELNRELTAEEILGAFYQQFVNVDFPLELVDYELIHNTGEKGEVTCQATIKYDGQEKQIKGIGNGPINAFVHALDQVGLKNFTVTDYRSHAIRGGSGADAAAYIQLKSNEGKPDEAEGASSASPTSDSSDTLHWGSGVDPSIEMAGLKALVTAHNLLNRDAHPSDSSP